MNNNENILVNSNRDKIYQYLEKNSFINFKKIDEVNQNDKIIQIYCYNLFNNVWFLYDFLIYISKCFKNYNINFYDQNNNLVTDKFNNEDFILKTNTVLELCEKYQLNLSITYIKDQKAFTASKMFINNDKILFISNNDQTGVNLTETINFYIDAYLNYIQSEHIHVTIEAFKNNSEPTKTILLSSFMLIDYMLNLDDNKYYAFYEENIKWIEKSFDFVSSDKDYWMNLLKKIEDKIIKSGI